MQFGFNKPGKSYHFLQFAGLSRNSNMENSLVTRSEYETLIFNVRGKKVMIDYDLALLYDIPTKALKQQVRRNIARFPDDFMFELTDNEKCELVTNCDRLRSLKHSNVKPLVFTITTFIHIIRSEKVLLDVDLASLYEVEVKTLKRSVKRNMNRFPSDFMFELSKEENNNLRYNFGTSSWGGSRYQQFAFTEQGVAMLSSVLNSPKAIEVNIAIMRAFVQMRKFLESHKELALKIEESD
jgi:phage regulator Rha-like protein